MIRPIIALLCFAAAGFTQTAPQEPEAVEQLVGQLLAAGSEQEREALLSQRKALISQALVDALLRQGDGLRSKRQVPGAMAAYETARLVAERLGDQAQIATALDKIGAAYMSQRRFTEALEARRKSLAILEKLGLPPRVAVLHNNLAMALTELGDQNAALEHLGKCLSIWRQLGDEKAQASCLTNTGLAHSYLGDDRKALEYYRKSLSLQQGTAQQSTAERWAVANLHQLMGSSFWGLGDYMGASESLNKALNGFEEIKDRPGEARALLPLGNVQYRLGNFAEALSTYDRALKLNESLGNTYGAALAINNMGIVHRLRGDHARALEHYHRSLALAEKLGDKRAMLLPLSNLGGIFQRQGDHAQALEHYQRGLKLAQQAGLKPSLPTLLNNIGDVQRERGEYNAALDHSRRALELARELDQKPGIISSLSNLGMIHAARRQYSEALEFFQESLALAESSGSRLEISRELLNVAALHIEQKDWVRAIQIGERAARLAREIGSLDVLWESFTHVARAQFALGRPAAAYEIAQEAIATVETLRSQLAGGERQGQLFFEDKASPYVLAVDILVSQGRNVEALQEAERAKARVLLDVLETGRLRVTKSLTAAERERERSLRLELTSANAQVITEMQRAKPDGQTLAELKSRQEKARLSYDAFQTSLFAAHPELRVHRGNSAPWRLEDARSIFTDGRSALLEFVVGPQTTYIFLLTESERRTELDVFSVDLPSADLTRRVTEFRQQLARRDLGFTRGAEDLYRLLLGPVQARLQKTTELIIVPDGPLWELPFQALRAHDGRYLIEQCDLSFAPSLSVLREMDKRKSDSPNRYRLLAMGNPSLGADAARRARAVYRDLDLGPLPDAEREVKALGSLYGQGGKVYVGAEAREDRIKGEGGEYTLLHLSTHGILNDVSPMYSHIVLSQSGGPSNDDGLLEAWEIMELDLKADLVVVSACETALGRVGAGEGMIGLSWALFVAGTPSIVVSQWKVDSASTAELMLEFHTRLRAGVTKARALREAARKLLRAGPYRHPFYWAPFVLIGNSR
jgi:CHAT domain-containing protein/Tfp pilus assembly protein PilF